MSALEVARITGAHALKGVVKVQLHWPDSSSLFDAEAVDVELRSGERRRLALENVTQAGRGLLVKFATVDDRDGAEALIGSKIFIERSALPPLEEGEAYLVDLIGAEVVAPDGVVGEVVDVRVNPTVDSLVVRCPDGKLVEQMLVDAFVESVDAAARRVTLRNRDGLVE